ncbi:MAG: hypothetical protein JWQ40_3900 [Segetibacter sp.]|nr:hypothetical protein [Segetibacter sp.]
MKRLLLLSLVSFAFFFARGQALQLEHPAKGDVWTAFSTQKIQWQAANVDNIKIELSTDSGRSWSVIQESYPAPSNSYDWEVVNKQSDSCYIRISDIENTAITSSNYPGNPFSIPKPAVTLDPVESTSVFGNTALPIRWTSSGIGNVRLLASYNNKLSFTQIADNIPANTGLFNWVVKDTNAAKCYILIQSQESPELNDTSNVSFTLRTLPVAIERKYKGGSYDGFSSATNKEKSIDLLTPNAADSLAGNTQFAIRWRSTAVDEVDLWYSIDNGVNWVNIAATVSAASQTYNWTVPAAPSAKCLVKISDASEQAFFDISDAPFVIKENTLELLTPGESETRYKGQVIPITWNSTGVSTIKIEYLDGTSWKTITNTANASHHLFNWVIPVEISDSVKLKISDANNPATTYSDAKILLKSTPAISAAKYKGGSYDGHSYATNKAEFLLVDAPNETLQLAAEQQYHITWKSQGVEDVDLAFSADAGLTWQNIVTSYSNAGSYLWSVPSVTSNTCLIRIRSSYDSSITDQSDEVFKILPGILDLVIDTVITRVSGTAMPLEWTHEGIEKVALSYKLSQSGRWFTITEQVDATEKLLNWTLPEILGDSLWIRISDSDNESILDVQLFAGVFKKAASFSSTKFHGGSYDGHSFRSNNNKLSILKPAANDTLTSGSTFPIRWSNQSVADSVLLQYSTDSGRTWINIGSAAATSGRYNWTVPSSPLQGRAEAAGILGDCMVRAIETGAGNEVVGKSNSTFSIVQSGTLAVSFIFLKARLTGDVVRLEWTAENELNFDRYEVERSTDAISYQKIGEVKANNLHNYTFDDNARAIEMERVFYRIKKVDRDGQFIYTSIVPINIPVYDRFTVYPNPVSNILTIKMKGLLTGNIKIIMVDMTGKVVKQSTKKATGSTVSISTDGLTSGTYNVKILYKGKEYIKKVIVIK